jgi:hypothetical protein
MRIRLESCRPCRRRLESLAAGGRWWDELRFLLGSRPEGDTSDAGPGAAGPQTHESQEAGTGAGPAVDFLSPCDDPRSLGRLGPYKITGILGAGGMGVVLKALDTAVDRAVAIKVLAPDGRPFRDGATVDVFYRDHRMSGTGSDAATGTFYVPCEVASIVDGRFRTTRADIVGVAASRDGFGFGWADLDAIEAGRELIVQLVADQPVRGLVLDSEGKPVPGARVNVEVVWPYPMGEIGRVLRALREGRPAGIRRSVWKGNGPGQFGGTTTRNDGRFHLARLGRDRVVHLRIDGPSIRPASVTVLTVAPGTPLPDHDEDGRAVYGATFVHRATPAAPSQPEH